MSRFIHLDLHTEYSIVDGLIRVKPLIERVTELGMPAVAITDLSNVFAAVKHYRAAQSAGIKPIIGAELRLDNNTDTPDHFIALCQHIEGFRNLSRLISKAFLEGQGSDTPLVKWSWLEELSEGLIILSGGHHSDVGHLIEAGNLDDAKACCQRWLGVFADRFYLKLQRTGHPGQENLIGHALDISVSFSIPVVATNAARFIMPDDFEAHEARVCINDGRTLDDPRRPKNYTKEQYLRSPEEMRELFKDIPEAIENSWHIAQRCNIEMNFGEYFLPNFPVPENNSLDDWFRQQSQQGLEDRLKDIFDTDASDFTENRKAYDERLELELGVINKMGFPGYFLIVADFIQWAKENAIPVGPGRGSGAGSLVAYALKITDLDPLEYELLFERFLNPERISMPDFDVDFCMDRRDEVIEYVARKYGRDHVSQIITHGTMAAKAVVRDTGRVLGLPYGFVDQIAKLVPFDLKMTLDKALREEEALAERYEQEDDVHDLIDLARKLEGTVRNVGKHAGGVVIAPTPMTDFVPLYCESNGNSVVCQYDMIDVESIGLVKFDFLGLRTLTIIDWAIRDIDRISLQDNLIDISKIDLGNNETYKLIQRAETTAVFQLESRGMKELIKRLKPDVFDDLIALVALFRPGPLQSGMVDDFIERKHGRQKVDYPHPDLEAILKPTYGVILYQEQVMQIAQVLAGYSLGAADMLRRAMGKKKPEEMAKQRAIFSEGAEKNGIDPDTATYIFDLMEKFAGYGFNKSHSAAYALVAYQTAWLKAHYPAAFMAAVLSSDMDNTDKVVGLIDECRRMDVKVISPNVNSCYSKFTTQDENTIRYGLGAIKGVGESAIDLLVEEREANGDFSDLFDLCRRMDTRKMNRRVLEALIRSGAMDDLGPGRSSCFASLACAIKLAEQHSRDSTLGQNDMFGLIEEAPAADTHHQAFVIEKQWSEEERLAGEKQTLGLYLSGHPIDRYEHELDKLVSRRLKQLKTGPQRVAGMIIGIRAINTRRGRMAIATLDDKTGRVEVVVYTDVLAEFGEYLSKDRVVIVEGECRDDEFTGGFSVIAETISDMEKTRANHVRRLLLRLGKTDGSGQQVAIGNGLLPELQTLLAPHKNGPCKVVLELHTDEATAKVELGQEWRINIPDRLLDQLREKFGIDQVNLEF